MESKEGKINIVSVLASYMVRSGNKRQLLRSVLSVIVLLVSVISIQAQKKITPVDNDPEKPPQPILHFYDKHGEPLDEPVLFVSDLDTVRNVKPKPVYPLLYSANVGFNFFDGVMSLFGQKHSSYDIQASLSLFNWIEPIVEFGIGFASNRPETGNFWYKNKPSFYGKIGFNYNFMYKSNPAYQVYLGMRFGYSAFNYELTDVTISSDYWDQTNTFSITDQKASAFYGQAVAGLKVQIWKWISLGWNLRYGFKMKQKNPVNSTPWFIPGYGTGAMSASFSIIFNIPIHTQKLIESPAEKVKAIGEGDVHVSGGIPEP